MVYGLEFCLVFYAFCPVSMLYVYCELSMALKRHNTLTRTMKMALFNLNFLSLKINPPELENMCHFNGIKGGDIIFFVEIEIFTLF